jgi:hypothetical protein
MAVTIIGLPRRRRGSRPNRSVGFENEVRRYAQEFISRQQAGYITSRDLSAKLNEDDVRSKDGKPWSESKVSRMIRRGHELGLPFIRRTRSEAASVRRLYPPRADPSKPGQIDAGIIAPSLMLLKRAAKR